MTCTILGELYHYNLSLEDPNNKNLSFIKADNEYNQALHRLIGSFFQGFQISHSFTIHIVKENYSNNNKSIFSSEPETLLTFIVENNEIEIFMSELLIKNLTYRELCSLILGKLLFNQYNHTLHSMYHQIPEESKSKEMSASLNLYTIDETVFIKALKKIEKLNK